MIERIDLHEIYALIGGKSNIAKVYDKENAIYFYLKDAGIVNLQKLHEMSDFGSVELNGSRLVVSEKGENDMGKYQKLSEDILENVGGKDNISAVTHCVTRLRLTLKNNDLVNKEAINNLEGVLGSQFNAGQYQVIIGQQIPEVAADFAKVSGLSLGEIVNENLDGADTKKKLTLKDIPNAVLNTISAIVFPVIPIYLGAGLILLLINLLGPTIFNIIPADSNFAVFMNDWNLQKRLQPIGERYELPMVSVKDAVVPQFEKSHVITKRQFFYDIYHPTNDGHRIMADCIANLFEKVDKEEVAEQDISLDKEPVYGAQFKDLIRFDRTNAEDFAVIEQNGYDAKDTDIQYVERDMDLNGSPEFADNWMNDGSVTGAEFRMTITCKNLVAVIKDSGSSEFGTADILVDGNVVKQINPLDNGWAHCNPQILIDEKESKKHEVVFRMKEGDEAKKFTILGFGVTR